MTLENRKKMAKLYEDEPDKYPQYKVYADEFKTDEFGDVIKPAKKPTKKRGKK